MGLGIPQSAGVRRSLVRQDDLSLITSELDLKVDQINAQLGKISFIYFIYFKRVLCDLINLFSRGKF